MAIILFDNDGVLMHSDEMYSQKIVRERNLDENLVKDFFLKTFVPKCMVGEADLKIELAKVLPLWGVEESVDEILKEWFESEKNIDLNVKNLIQSLKNLNHQCYLATNQDEYRTQYLEKELGFSTLFDGIFSSARLNYKKPNPKFYLKIKELLNLQSFDDIIYIDDEEKNVQAARNLGIESFQYIEFDNLIEFLKSKNIRK